MPAEPSFAPVREEFRAHAVENGVIAAGEREGEAGSVLGVAEAAAMLRTGFASARRRLHAAKAVPRGSRRGVRTRLHPEHVGFLGARIEDAIGTTELSRILGIGRRQVQELVATGMLEAAVLVDEPKGGRRYSRKGATRFLARCLDRCPATRARGGMPLPRACQAAGVRISDALRAVLDGRVRPSGRGRRDGGVSPACW